jgi:hypothetical protein
MYDFKQSQIDRLEDAGVKGYSPKDGYRVFRGHGPRLSLKKARTALSAMFSLFV